MTSIYGELTNTMRLNNIEYPSLVAFLPITLGTSIADELSMDDRLITSGGYNTKNINIRNASSGEIIRTFEAYTHRITEISVSPTGNLLASVSWDGIISISDTTTGEKLNTLQYCPTVYTVAFSQTGKILAAAAGNNIVLWNVITGVHINTLKGHIDRVKHFAFMPSGCEDILASGSLDNTICIWNVITGKIIRTLTGHSDCVRCVAFSPTGDILASGSWDNTIGIWNVGSGEILNTLKRQTPVVGSCRKIPPHHRAVYSVAFSPTGNILASGSWDNTICIWDVRSGENLKTLKGHSDIVRTVAFSPTGEWLASASVGCVCVWDFYLYTYPVRRAVATTAMITLILCITRHSKLPSIHHFNETRMNIYGFLLEPNIHTNNISSLDHLSQKGPKGQKRTTKFHKLSRF
jgi:WD40 repeat protein